MSHSQFHCTSRAYLDMHGLIFETSICYWQDQPGRSAVSQRQRAPPEGRRRPAVGRTCRARGGTRARTRRRRRQPTPSGAQKPAGPGRKSGRDTLSPLNNHGPPHPQRRARLTDRPRPTRTRAQPAAAWRGEGRFTPPPPPGAVLDGGARARTGHRAVTPRPAGRRALTRHRGGGPQAGARPPPPPPGRQRAAATATTDSRDPTHARARAPERGATAGGGAEAVPSSAHNATAGLAGGGGHGWEAAAGLGSASAQGARHRIGSQTGGGHKTAQRRGTRRRQKQEKRRGRREDGGQPRGSSGSPFKSASGPKVGHRGPHGVPPPEASSTRAVPWHPRTPTWPPRRALATSRGSGPETPPTHHRSHARPPETLSRTHNDATPATQLEAGPARALLSSSPGDREHFAWGRPPPGKPVATARGGDDTQTSGEAGFGPERADRGHRRAFRQSGRGNGSGSASAAPGRRKHSGRGPGARGGRTGSGKGAPTKTQAGPPGKRARDPTATSTRAVPRRPGRQPASAPLASLPTNRAPHRCGPDPREPPPRGPVLNLRPSGPSRKVATLEKRPQARAARPVPGTPPPSGDSGRERAGRQPLARHGEAGRAGAPPEPLGRQHREGAAARALARTRTREPHAPDAGQARRDPPPTRRGEAQAAVGKERRSAPPRGRQNQTPSQRGRALPNTQR